MGKVGFYLEGTEAKFQQGLLGVLEGRALHHIYNGQLDE